MTDSDQKRAFDPKTGELVVNRWIGSGPNEIPGGASIGVTSPDDIVSLLLAAIYLCGSVTLSINLIKLRIEKEKVKKIRIKKGIYELEIYGTMSEKEIGNRIEQFRKLLRDVEIDAGDIHIYTNKYFERIDSYHEHDDQ